jgi:hypothetical protein
LGVWSSWIVFYKSNEISAPMKQFNMSPNFVPMISYFQTINELVSQVIPTHSTQPSPRREGF